MLLFQTGGAAKPAAAAVSDASSSALVSDQAGPELTGTDHTGGWASRDDIYIDDEDDDEDDEDWEGSGSPNRGHGSQSGSRRGKGGGSRNRDDLEASGSGAGPVRGGARGHIDEEDEDIEQGSGARPDGMF